MTRQLTARKRVRDRFSLISIHDPAIDWPHEDAKRAFAASRDESTLTFHEGAKPARFVCRTLSAPEIDDTMIEFHAYAGASQQKLAGALAAFERGCVRIEGLLVDDGDGAVHERTVENTPKDAEVIESLPFKVRLDIGAVIFTRSTATEVDSGK